ncbi:hypothetical protein HK101_002288, partial [Irineochytrium annulatum]
MLPKCTSLRVEVTDSPLRRSLVDRVDDMHVGDRTTAGDGDGDGDGHGGGIPSGDGDGLGGDGAWYPQVRDNERGDDSVGSGDPDLWRDNVEDELDDPDTNSIRLRDDSAEYLSNPRSSRPRPTSFASRRISTNRGILSIPTPLPAFTNADDDPVYPAPTFHSSPPSTTAEEGNDDAGVAALSTAGRLRADSPIHQPALVVSPVITLRSQYPTIHAPPGIGASYPPVTAMVSVKAPPLPDGAPTASIDLVAVVDVSGSMSGTKLAAVKSTLTYVVSALSGRDRLAIVTFSDDATLQPSLLGKDRLYRLRCTQIANLAYPIDIPFIPLASRLRDTVDTIPSDSSTRLPGPVRLQNTIDNLHTMAGTNIYSGLDLALQTLQGRSSANSCSAILLLSDGQDTARRKATEYDELVARARRLGAPIFTFGYGLTHDDVALLRLAGAGGTFTFIRSTDVVRDAFAGCIGGVKATLFKSLAVSITCRWPADDCAVHSQPPLRVKIRDVHCAYPHDLDADAVGVVIDFGDLFAEESRDAVLTLTLEPTGTFPITTASSISLLRADASYSLITPSLSHHPHLPSGPASLSLPLLTTPGQARELPDLHVCAQQLRLLVLAAVREAIALSDTGDHARARRHVLAAREWVLQSCAGAHGWGSGGARALERFVPCAPPAVGTGMPGVYGEAEFPAPVGVGDGHQEVEDGNRSDVPPNGGRLMSYGGGGGGGGGGGSDGEFADEMRRLADAAGMELGDHTRFDDRAIHRDARPIEAASWRFLLALLQDLDRAAARHADPEVYLRRGGRANQSNVVSVYASQRQTFSQGWDADGDGYEGEGDGTALGDAMQTKGSSELQRLFALLGYHNPAEPRRRQSLGSCLHQSPEDPSQFGVDSNSMIPPRNPWTPSATATAASGAGPAATAPLTCVVEAVVPNEGDGVGDRTIKVLGASDALLELVRIDLRSPSSAGAGRPWGAYEDPVDDEEEASRACEELEMAFKGGGASEWLRDGGQAITKMGRREITWRCVRMRMPGLEKGSGRRTFLVTASVAEIENKFLSFGIGANGMGDIISAFPWTQRCPDLGPIPTWPSILRQAVTICINAPVPCVLLWGRNDRVVSCNDRYLMISSSTKTLLGLKGTTFARASSLSGHRVVEALGDEYLVIDDLARGVDVHNKLVELPIYDDVAPASGTESPVSTSATSSAAAVVGRLVCLVETVREDTKLITISLIRDFGVRLLQTSSTHQLWRIVFEWLQEAKRYFPKSMIYIPTPDNASLAPIDALCAENMGVPATFTISPSSELTAKQRVMADCFRSGAMESASDVGGTRCYAAPITLPDEEGVPALALLYVETDLEIPPEEYAGAFELIRNEIVNAYGALADAKAGAGGVDADSGGADALRGSSLWRSNHGMAKEFERGKLYKFLRMAERAPVALYRTDGNGLLLHWNETFLQMLNLPRSHFEDTAKECGSYRDVFRNRIHPDDRGWLIAMFMQNLKAKNAYDSEYRLVQHESGKVIWVGSQCNVDLDDDGDFQGFVFALTDITEKRRLEDERLVSLQLEEAAQRRRADEAEESRRQQESFIDMVCHEIRNPLNGISNNNEFTIEALQDLKAWAMARTEIDSEFTEAFKRGLRSTSAISHCARHMKHVADDVLNLSKLSLNLMKVSTTMPFTPHTVVEDLMATFRADLDSKSIAHSVHLGPGYTRFSHETFLGDPARLTQVIINLVTNAIKFTEKVAERRIDILLDADP